MTKEELIAEAEKLIEGPISDLQRVTDTPAEAAMRAFMLDGVADELDGEAWRVDNWIAYYDDPGFCHVEEYATAKDAESQFIKDGQSFYGERLA